MRPGNSADLSVVIATPDRYDTIRKTINCLRKQTVRHQLEVIIVAPSVEDLRLEEAELTDFFGFHVVEVGAIRSIASANAAGIRKATAPIVALGEDHAFPARDWAEVLIDAHREDWAAVGPEVRNANPETAISWADYFMGYGPWIAPAIAGQIEHLPGHNSSYKRDILLEYGAELETMLGAETVLHWHLCSKGHRLYLEPKARIAHCNFDRLRSWLSAVFLQRTDLCRDSLAELVMAPASVLYFRDSVYTDYPPLTYSKADKKGQKIFEALYDSAEPSANARRRSYNKCAG